MLGAREVRRPVARGLVLRRHIEADRQLTEFRTRGFHCGRRNLGTQHKEITMQRERPEPNAELNQTFEPLRLVFAIGALVLGLVASLHF